MRRLFDMKRLRQDMGMRQSEFARILDIPQSSISSMECGKTKVSKIYIEKLAIALAVPNIEDYYNEYPDVHIHNEGIVGDNNGYNAYNSTAPAPAINEGLILSRLAVLERDLAKLVERTERYEQRYEEVREKNERLHRQLTAFQVLCTRNNIDFDHILNIE